MKPQQIRKHLESGDLNADPLLTLLTGKIKEKTDPKEWKTLNRKMRIELSKMPDVGSCHRRGYFLIKTESDLHDSISDLRSRAKSIFKRADKQYTNFGLKFQPELIFKGI